MAYLKIKNRAFSTLAADIISTATSLSVAAGEGAKFPSAGDFHITIEDEILKCTAITTDTLTVTRAQEGTTAAAHAAGKSVELRITAGVLESRTTWTADKLLKGAGADTPPTEIATDTALITSGRFVLARLPDGTAGYFLKAAGAGVDPAFAALAAGDIASGRLVLARLPDGTSGYFLKAGGAGIDPAYALLVDADIPATIARDAEVTTAVSDHTALPSAHHSNVITITFIIDGGGAAITTGEKGHLEVPFACTIKQVTMLADASGSIVVDIWKNTYALFPPADANSITSTTPPTISAAQKSQDSTLTGWTTSIAAGDILAFNVDSVATVTRVTISIRATKT